MPATDMDLQTCYACVTAMPDFAPLHDLAITEVYQTILAAGDTAVDGGAHAGKHTIPMARAVGPTGSVLAFEPLVEARQRLVAALTAASLDNVVVSPEALSDVAGRRVEFLYFPRRPGISGFVRREGVDDLEAELREATTTTIDQHAAHRDVRFMKLDTEGAELLALRGAEATVQASRPIIHVEAGVPSWRPFGFDASDLTFWCKLRAYRCFDLVGNEFADHRSLHRSFSTAGVWDYVLIPAESTQIDAVRTVLDVHRRRYVDQA